MIKLRKCSECENERHATEKFKTCSNACKQRRYRRIKQTAKKQDGE